MNALAIDFVRYIADDQVVTNFQLILCIYVN